MKPFAKIVVTCIAAAACCVSCKKDAAPTGPAASDVVGTWAGSFTYGQSDYRTVMKIESDNACTTTVMIPASGGIPEVPVFVTMGTWAVSGSLFKITATKCLSFDTATFALKEIPVDQSPMGGSKDIPININGNQWVYTDPQLKITVTCIKQ